jgi:hypothetical protein
MYYLQYLMFHSSADPVEHTGAASDRLSREGTTELSFQLLQGPLENEITTIMFLLALLVVPLPEFVEVDRIILVHRKVARGSTLD